MGGRTETERLAAVLRSGGEEFLILEEELLLLSVK